MPPSWHPVPACAPRPCCRRAVLLCDEENWNRTRRRCDYDCCRRDCSTLRRRKLESDAVRYCSRGRCHSGGFLLRIMPPSWHPVPACSRLRPARSFCRRAIHLCRRQPLQRFSNSPLQIRNHCSVRTVSGENLAAIAKFDP